MKTFEEYKAKESKIEKVDNLYRAFVHGEPVGEIDYSFIQDAQDDIEDILMEELRSDHKYICDFCNLFCDRDEVRLAWDDSEFTYRYGDMVEVTEKNTIAQCPVCGDDLEETR